MKPSRWMAFGALLWLVLVIKDLPARWGGDLLGQYIRGLQLRGVSGSLWSGRAGEALLRWHGDSYSLGEIQWRLRPGSLLLFSPCVDFSAEFNRQRFLGEACFHLDGDFSLRNSEFSGPAALVELWLPVKVAGDLSVRINSLRLDGDRVEVLQADSDWRNARFHNSHQWLHLGSFRSKLNGDNKGGVAGSLFDVGGPLAVELALSLPYQQPLVLQGSVELRQNAAPEIGQFLKVMGYRQVSGRYEIRWERP